MTIEDKINREEIMSTLLENSLKNLVSQGCNAASLLIYKNSKLVYYKTTNHKFEDVYLNAKEQVANCHLAAIATKRIIEQKPYSLIWDNALPTNEESLYLNELRLKHNHCHGITILNPMNDELLFGLTLVGKRSDVNLPYLVLQNKKNLGDKFIEILHAYNSGIKTEL